MPVVNPTTAPNLATGGDDYVIAMSWALDSDNTDATPIARPMYADRVFTVTGTWNGARLVIEGSGDGERWVPLIDVHGKPALLNADGMVHIQATPLYTRPRLIRPGGRGLDEEEEQIAKPRGRPAKAAEPAPKAAPAAVLRISLLARRFAPPRL